MLVYPTLPGLTYATHWKPRFFNIKTLVAATGAEIDLGLAATPLHDFELTYAFLRRGFPWVKAPIEFQTLIGFFGAMSGNLGRFGFKNPDDSFVRDQTIGTGDGVTTTFTLQRTFGAGDYSWTEPVGYLDLTMLANFDVYVNGASVGRNYTLNTATGGAQTVTLAYPPPVGAPVTVDMDYLYYCKLADDNADFEQFMHNLWTLKKITLRSCRPGA